MEFFSRVMQQLDSTHVILLDLVEEIPGQKI